MNGECTEILKLILHKKEIYRMDKLITIEELQI